MIYADILELAVVKLYMYYKLSNSAKRNVIESEMGLKFRFSGLYTSSPLIDGLNEELLPIITSENDNEINFGIWGILPHKFKEEWSDFQKIRNTLNVDVRTIDSYSDYKEALNLRRCLVLVTGFFASYNFRGQIYPVYIYPKAKQVFSIAAIYNITKDGFITFTILLEKSNYEMSKIQNISDSMPIVLNQENQNIWLSENYEDLIFKHNDSYEKLNFASHTIAKEFYKNNIIYDSILEPATYTDLIKF